MSPERSRDMGAPLLQAPLDAGQVTRRDCVPAQPGRDAARYAAGLRRVLKRVPLKWINGNSVIADAIDSQTEAPDRRVIISYTTRRDPGRSRSIIFYLLTVIF